MGAGMNAETLHDFVAGLHEEASAFSAVVMLQCINAVSAGQPSQISQISEISQHSQQGCGSASCFA